MTTTSATDREYVTLNGFRDLECFGINSLTGEACAFSQRMLCDVNAEGLTLLADFFGIPELKLAPPMNTTVNGAPAVGSIMLERLSWRGIGSFAFFRSGALAILDEAGTHMMGVYSQDLFDRYRIGGYDLRVNPATYSTAPRVGSRNVHAMTGRVI